MDIDLDQRPVTDRAETMDLAGLDHEDIPRGDLEFLAVNNIGAAAFPHELHFIVGMPMGPRSTTWWGSEEERGDTHVAVVGADEVVGEAFEWQVFLTDAIHAPGAPLGFGFNPKYLERLKPLVM
jgi:hypothetical protein